jgi:fatty acid desaturase
MPEQEHKPTDLRELCRQTDRRLLVAVIVALVVVGGVAIGAIYGWQSIFTALICLIPGAGVIVLLFLFWGGIERWLRKDE